MAQSTTEGTRYPSLRERNVFVTGGGSGIGATIVRSFAAQGARVAFVDIAPGPSGELVRAIAGDGLGEPWWRQCDVRDIKALQSAIAAAAETLGDFHVLVNNVASDDRHTLESITPEYYDERIAVNQRAALFALQAVVPGMRRLGGGSIINIGSNSWLNKQTNLPVYAIAKSAVNGLTRSMAGLLGPDGIRVNTVTPGWVMTERQLKLWMTPEGERSLERNQCLPGRLMPQDIANMVLFLAADDSRMCTANEYRVDAGWS